MPSASLMATSPLQEFGGAFQEGGREPGAGILPAGRAFQNIARLPGGRLLGGHLDRRRPRP